MTAPKDDTRQLTTPEVPNTTPDRIAINQPGHDFTLQTIMQLQRSVGELTAEMRTLVKTVEGLGVKIDSVNDLKPSLANLTKTVDGSAKKLEKLTTWKAMIVGGAVVVGVVAAAVWSAMGLVAKVVPTQGPVSMQAPVAPATPAILPVPAPAAPRASN